MKVPFLPLFLAACAWWTLEGLVTTGQLLTMQFDDRTVGAVEALRRGLLSAWLWIPCSLLLLCLSQRWPVERGRRAASLTLLTAAVGTVVLFRAISMYAFNPVLGWYETLPPFQEVLLTSVFNNLLLAWLMVGIGHALLFWQRARERQRQAEELQMRLVETRLEALRAQLDPHFLFNALNSIAEIVHRDSNAADRMLVGLGALLRSSLDRRQTWLVPLREELRLLAHYLEIEKARFGDRLHLRWDIADGLDDAHVPPLLLQPLAENAIRHAIAERIAPGHLDVIVGRDGDWISMTIRDDGQDRARPRAIDDDGCVHGSGLRNIQARLECLYGSSQALRICHRADGTEATVRVPLRWEQSAKAA